MNTRGFDLVLDHNFESFVYGFFVGIYDLKSSYLTFFEGKKISDIHGPISDSFK